jgi:hypothetical protein
VINPWQHIGPGWFRPASPPAPPPVCERTITTCPNCGLLLGYRAGSRSAECPGCMSAIVAGCIGCEPSVHPITRPNWRRVR